MGIKKAKKLMALTLATAIIASSGQQVPIIDDVFKTISVEAAGYAQAEGFGYQIKPDGTAMICEYNGRSGYISVPTSLGGATVTEIGEEAFAHYWDDGSAQPITDIIIPNTVTKIGNGAFSDTPTLKNVTLPDSVTEIGDDIFYGAVGLVSVNIPASITELNSNMFAGCTALRNVSLPSTLKTIKT